MFTQGYGGQDVSKVITVESNDPERPEASLKVAGKVEDFANLKPDRIQLTGLVGSPVSARLVITPRPEYPFRVMEVKLQRGGDVKLTVDPKTGQPGKPEYVVTLDNLRKDPGRYYDNLLIRTDSKINPELRVAVYGNITKPSEAGQEKPPAQNESESPDKNRAAPAASPS